LPLSGQLKAKLAYRTLMTEQNHSSGTRAKSNLTPHSISETIRATIPDAGDPGVFQLQKT